MTRERARLAQEEDEGWTQLCGLIEGLTPEQLEEAGLTAEGWSVKDLLWHLGCWWAEAGRELERIRMGTYVEPADDTEALNARFLEEGRARSISDVRAQLSAARTMALRVWGTLPEVTPEAAEWFEETGPLHYREHLEDLQAWVEHLGSA